MPTEWILGLVGGLMIGSAAALFLLGNGRIMGASGILAGLFNATSPKLWAERAVFAIGLIGCPAVLVLLFAPQAQTNLTGNTLLIVAAGLLVGLGTRLGNGCTSGHGVCGISRLSLRGIVATLCFIATGIVTVTLMRLIGGGL